MARRKRSSERSPSLPRWASRFWQGVQDACVGWLQPTVAFLTLGTGALLTSDYEAWQAENPTWEGPIGFAEAFLPYAFWASAIATLVVGIIAASRRETHKQLRAELAKHTGQVDEIGNVIVQLFDGLLLNLADKLELAQNSQARLSLYLHDGEAKAFIPCGRYSRNPEYRQPGRTSYPDHQGCIGRGWHSGWHFDAAVPPDSQAAGRRAYNARTYNVPDAVTDSIRMKSTLYAAIRLANRDGRDVAVLVVESTSSTEFEETRLRDTLAGSINDYAKVIHELRAYVPDPTNAAESGL